MRAAGLEPLEPFPGSTKKWLCKCTTCGHVGPVTYHSINSQGSGCLRCGRARAAAALRLDPDVAAEAMRGGGYAPLVPYAGSGTPWPCTCLVCGRFGTPTLDNVRQGYGCMHCGRERTIAARRLDPDLAADVMRGRGFEPLVPFTGAADPWLCRCTACGRESTPGYHSVSRGSGCRYCGRRVVDPDEAAQFMRSRGLEPLTPYPGSVVPWLSRCTECDTETTRVSYHALATSEGRRGCPPCGFRRRGLGRRFDEQLAVAIMREAGFEPEADFPGKAAPWPSRCLACQRSGTRTLNGVLNGRKCNWCSGHWVDAEEAADLMRENGFEPQGPYPGSDKPWPATCIEAGHASTPTYSNVRSGYGCRGCADRGFDFNSPSTVYVMTNPKLGAVKIGIGGLQTRHSRIDLHTRHGWILDSTFETTDGTTAYLIEQAVLRHLKQELGLRHFLDAADMPQGGRTETFDRSIVGADDLRRLVLAEARILGA
ncbi:hypothetical protein [Kitasatospora cineracea]|uniref:hypothetical protein n=1 Tax=Kitasatospora cineracea TaxID=88074 RepID=UPI0033FA9EE5